MSKNKKALQIALAGNPNSGKTTLFNQLTGSNQYVGNWPGVTVEKKVGRMQYENQEIDVVDLPGIYSLSPYSQEEIVSRNCIINDNPDIIINIVDSTNLERNLYLTTQIMELNVPMIIALNMTDILEKRGDKLNAKVLQKELGVPVVKISASKGTGIAELIKLSVELASSNYIPKRYNIYSPKVVDVISSIEKVIDESPYVLPHQKNRFTAVKFFEGDMVAWHDVKISKEDKEKIESYRKEIPITQNVDHTMIIADERYKYICHICVHAVTKLPSNQKLTWSDKIDKIVTNRFLAIPVFLFVMLLTFFITFGPIGGVVYNSMETLIDTIASNLQKSLISLGASDWAVSLVTDGVIHGVGAVLAFLPQILILFTILSILEDSGYMARAAFIMDHLLRKIGLSGKAFVPMLMGFGCTVPAVLATKALDTDKDKRLTILITPFMSCSAKMTVYALFVGVFFRTHQALIILSIYLLGIFIAVVTALLFKDKIMKGHASPFVMELPPYRMPTVKTLWLHISERVKDFVVKAGTVILGANIIIWFLQSFDMSFEFTTDNSVSILSQIGTLISPLFSFCGFGDWKAAVSLITGLIAKESVVATMSVLYGGVSNLSKAFTPLSAYAFMVFVLLYTPCVAAMSAIAKEMKSVKWTIFTIIYQLVVAWFVAALVYQFGLLISNINGVIVILALLAVLIMIFYIVKSYRKGKCPPCSGQCNHCSRK